MQRFIIHNGGILVGALDTLAGWGIEGEFPDGSLLVRADRPEVEETLRAIGGEVVPQAWMSRGRSGPRLAALHATKSRVSPAGSATTVGEMLIDLLGPLKL